MKLVTRRLLLRPPRPDDVAPINAICNDWAVARWISVPHPCPFGFTLQRFQKLLEAPDGEYCLVLVRKKDRSDTAIGMVFSKWVELKSAPMIGFYLNSAHTGKGLMTEALRAAIPAIFEKSDASQVKAACFEGNEASEHLLAKLGFERDGVQTSFNQATKTDETELCFELSRTSAV